MAVYNWNLKIVNKCRILSFWFSNFSTTSVFSWKTHENKKNEQQKFPKTSDRSVSIFLDPWSWDTYITIIVMAHYRNAKFVRLGFVFCSRGIREQFWLNNWDWMWLDNWLLTVVVVCLWRLLFAPCGKKGNGLVPRSHWPKLICRR